MKYKTLVFWTDLQDNKHPYNPGDEYPRKGLRPTKKRIAELSSDQNKRGLPLIKAVEE